MTENKGRSLLDDADEDEDEDAQRDKFLTFRIGHEDYALAISQIVEIVGILPVTEVPDMPDFVRGVINLRGRVIPAIDVRLRFGMEARPYDPRTCVIVVALAGTTAGLIVDSVSEVTTIPAAAMAKPPSVQQGRQSRFVQALGRVGDTVKIILDLGSLLLDRPMEIGATLSA
jgi:purine-binding chemotaxis protein CheW